MKILAAAAALVMASAVLALAPAQLALAQTHAKAEAGTTTHKAKKTTTQKRVVRASPYSTNAAHDVYVNGVYAGSDPDPRVRWQLKREFCSESVDGCGF